MKKYVVPSRSVCSVTRLLLLLFLPILLFGVDAVTASERYKGHHHGNRRSSLLQAPNNKQQKRQPWMILQTFQMEVTSSATETIPSSKMLKTAQSVIVSGSIIASFWLLLKHREGLASFFDKEKIQTKTLNILHNLNSYPKYRSYLMYALGMAFWETGGLSTIPVETAAGMVFGWDAFYLSAIGKLIGATLAFCLGRYGVLADWVHQKLGGNELLQLMKSSTETNPLLVSVLLKLSCFPETIKNYGSAILHPIKLWMFVVATGVHGGVFSALWTYLGVDTAKRLEDPTYPVDSLLGTLLSLALINGIVVSPLAMGVWIRDLKSSKKRGKITTQ